MKGTDLGQGGTTVVFGWFARVGGCGHESHVWKRKADAGNSFTTRASGSDETGFEKWDEAAGVK